MKLCISVGTYDDKRREQATDFTQELVRRHPSSWFGSAADWRAMVFPVEAVCMATLQQQISDKFLAKLVESQRLGRLMEA
jgi:hypothetical protein